MGSTGRLDDIRRRKKQLLDELAALEAEEATCTRNIECEREEAAEAAATQLQRVQLPQVGISDTDNSGRQEGQQAQGEGQEGQAEGQEGQGEGQEGQVEGQEKQKGQKGEWGVDVGLGFVGNCKLSAVEVQRYSRQMLLPCFGIQAQERLRSSSILIIGAGGLGSPCALYLAAAGIGRLGIVDRDAVELSNLHRQILHTEGRVGQHKVDSAAEACRALNSLVTIELHPDGFTPKNALDIAKRYDVIVDASDNVTSRYLINDAAVVARKPLVFGAALGTEGQLTVYNHNGGPCFRCLFPSPPPAAACQRCSEAGVLGVVPGVIGVLQAVEAIKLVAALGSSLSSRMLHYDAMSSRFLQIKLRGRSKDCEVCGDNPTVTASNLAHVPFEEFTSTPFHDKGPSGLKLLSPQEQISPRALSHLLQSSSSSKNKTSSILLLDVRPRHLFQMAAIPKAFNIPLSELESRVPMVWAAMHAAKSNPGQVEGKEHRVLVAAICRRGNDSQRAVVLLKDKGITGVLSVKGGLQAWAAEVDAEFPVL